MVISVKVTRTGKHIAGIAWIWLGMQPAHAALMAELEGPVNEQPVSGIGIIRGWAFSDGVGVRISQVTLRIDGKDVTTIPCCGERADVQGAFPQFSADNTRNSGFGITFNTAICRRARIPSKWRSRTAAEPSSTARTRSRW